MKIPSVNTGSNYQNTNTKKESFGRLVGEKAFTEHIQTDSNMPYLPVKVLSDSIAFLKKEFNETKYDNIVVHFSVEKEKNNKSNENSIAGNKVIVSATDYREYPEKGYALDITSGLADIAKQENKTEYLCKAILEWFWEFAPKIYKNFPTTEQPRSGYKLTPEDIKDCERELDLDD